MKKPRDPVIIDVQPEELQREETLQPREPSHLEGMAIRLNEYAVDEVEGNLQGFIREAAPIVAIGLAVMYGAPYIEKFFKGK